LTRESYFSLKKFSTAHFRIGLGGTWIICFDPILFLVKLGMKENQGNRWKEKLNKYE
jgi:hypothetical protein